MARQIVDALLPHEGPVGRLYEDDILLWSEQQTEALRRQAARGPLPNDPAIDWPNVIEEVESVGREQLHAVESLLVQALRHMLKAHCWPLHRDAAIWRADALDFRAQAGRRFTPSMRQRIDMAELHHEAVRTLPETMHGLTPLPVPTELPTLEELLAKPE
jgi:hypothetical protein